ncbi:MAG: hypothetical protein WB445_04260 [Acinetobacter sp.]
MQENIKLTAEMRELARQNAYKFFMTESELEVQDVFRHAAFYGSNVTHAVVDKNAYFMDCGLLSAEYQADGGFYLYTGFGLISHIAEGCGWREEFGKLLDILELKLIYEKGMRAVKLESTVAA